MLRSFAAMDVIRNVCLRGRRSLFTFTHAGAPVDISITPAPAPLPIEHENAEHSIFGHATFQALMGLPVGLLYCIAATSDLALDEATMTKEVFKTRTDWIEQSIRKWKPLPIDPESLGEDSIHALGTSFSLTLILLALVHSLFTDLFTPTDGYVTHEMWRWAALIHLYQTLHHLGPLSPLIRRALSQLLSLGSRTSPPLLPPIAKPPAKDLFMPTGPSERACPWFLAATVAIQTEERDLCREGLKRCSPGK